MCTIRYRTVHGKNRRGDSREIEIEKEKREFSEKGNDEKQTSQI